VKAEPSGGESGGLSSGRAERGAVEKDLPPGVRAQHRQRLGGAASGPVLPAGAAAQELCTGGKQSNGVGSKRRDAGDRVSGTGTALEGDRGAGEGGENYYPSWGANSRRAEAQNDTQSRPSVAAENEPDDRRTPIGAGSARQHSNLYSKTPILSALQTID